MVKILYEEDEAILNEIANQRKLSKKTIQGYEEAIKIYTQVNQTSLTQLLQEADNEEEQGIRWKHRKLKTRLINYRAYLIDNYRVNTVKTYMTKIKTVYTHYELETQKIPNIGSKTLKTEQPINFKDIPTHEIIKKVVQHGNPFIKSIILFMTSSGCARAETLNLTIKDFINATNEYHNSTNIYDVINELKDKEDVIPTFRLKRQKTGKYYFTFCSPETVYEIIYYLQSRENLKEDDPLFDITTNKINRLFRKINNSLNLGKVGPYNRFRTHMLRKFHASNLYNSKYGLTLDEIDALQGRGKDSTHSSYFMENPANLKEKYDNAKDVLKIVSIEELKELNDSYDIINDGSHFGKVITDNLYLAKQKNGQYQIRKQINGKTYTFGQWHTLEKAREIRDELVRNDWSNYKNILYRERIKDSDKNISFRDGAYHIIKRVDTKNIDFGKYATIEEAREVRNRLFFNNWKTDKGVSSV